MAQGVGTDAAESLAGELVKWMGSGKSMLFVCSSMEVQRSVCWRWNSMADWEGR